MLKEKKWGISAIVLLILSFLGIAGAVLIVDPYFHFHAPLKNISYPIDNQRYQNNGILKNFEYNSIITGTSMTENFKTSEFDNLFGVNSIKVPFSGSYLRETSEQLEMAFKYNDNIEYVLRSLDFYALYANKDCLSDFEYPTYLYDENILNDVSYLFNKDIFLKSFGKMIYYNLTAQKTTSFDKYSYWSDSFIYGKEEVLRRYERKDKVDQSEKLEIIDIQQVKDNIDQNIIRLAEDNPECEFYLFFPPYSIVYWDEWSQNDFIENGIFVLESVTEQLLEYDNIHLFSFNTCFDIICDLDNYKDLEHYGEWINSRILKWMKNGQHELTKANYKAHYEEMREFYVNYEYDKIFNIEK